MQAWLQKRSVKGPFIFYQMEEGGVVVFAERSQENTVTNLVKLPPLVRARIASGHLIQNGYSSVQNVKKQFFTARPSLPYWEKI